jgi:hypothetical protein
MIIDDEVEYLSLLSSMAHAIFSWTLWGRITVVFCAKSARKVGWPNDRSNLFL